jgi:hypothetical protein
MLPVAGISMEDGRSVSSLNTGCPDLEAEDPVKVSVPVNVSQEKAQMQTITDNVSILFISPSCQYIPISRHLK